MIMKFTTIPERPQCVPNSCKQRDRATKDLVTGGLWALLTLSLSLFFAISPALATGAGQSPVTGTVKDASGAPVIGAVVTVSGTANGTLTDTDGVFSIQASGDAVLVVTYTGLLRQEVAVGGRRSVAIVMQDDVTALDDVIVVGYGTTSTRRTVSAVGTMKTDKIDQLPYTSTTASMQGRIAGVLVQSQDAQPGGAAPIISIRGGGAPLYVIDGIIRSAEDFNSLVSSDIESLNVLKDASATAVYGSRAGNGIVLVTTKTGASGLRVEYNGGFEFARPTKIADRVGALEYVLAANAAARLDGRGEYALYNQTQVDQIRTGTSNEYGNQDWYNEATRSWAPQQRHNITISGKNGGVNHFTSLGIFDQKSNWKQSHNNHFKKYNVRSNISHTFGNTGLEVGVNLDGTYEKRTPNPYGQEQIVRDITGYNKAIDLIYNPDGTYTARDIHPIVYLDPASGYTNNYRNMANVQAYADWSLPWVEGLSARLTGNSNYISVDEKWFKSRAPQYDGSGTLVGTNRVKELRMTRNWRRGNSLDFGIDYARQFGRHFLELQGVYSYYDEYYERFQAYRSGFISNDFDQLGAGDASTMTNDGGAAERTRIGYVGRVRYSFAEKYSLEANFRYDGNDNFSANKRWGFFPSAALAWTISEENFMKPLARRGILNFAKARVSYGQVGLDEGVERFGYIPVYSFNSQAMVIGGQYAPGFSEGNLVSPDELSWFTKDVFDVGLDLVFWKNRLSVTLDYYYYKTKGYLMSPTTGYTTTLGKGLPQIRSNSVHRREGFEAVLRYRNNYRDFNYDIGVNLTTYNELWEMKEDEAAADMMDPRKRVNHRTLYYARPKYDNGSPVNPDQVNFYMNNGLYRDNESILNSPHYTSATELQKGDLSYVDINGDGTIDSNDQVKTGKPFFPSFEYGIDFNLEYRGLFMSGLLQGTGNRTTELRVLYRGGNIVNSNYAFQMDNWTPDNTDATFPRSSALQSPNSGNNTLDSDYWLLNAKYFRLKSLQIGYDFKSVLFRDNNKISSFRISLLGTNLFTISETMKYFDPEAYNFGEAYPYTKTFSISLNIGI